MIFSKAILGTETNKVTMSWWEYWVGHCWMTGWQSIRSNFITWMDLVWFEDNQKHYTLLKDDIPFEQCYNELWFGLNDDDVYPKEFLEHLMQLADDVATGKEKVYPIGENILEDLHNLVDGLINPVDLNDLIDDEDLENEV
jgi:hypothetical protein